MTIDFLKINIKKNQLINSFFFIIDTSLKHRSGSYIERLNVAGTHVRMSTVRHFPTFVKKVTEVLANVLAESSVTFSFNLCMYYIILLFKVS